MFHLLTNLEELDLYDNKIKSVDGALDKLSNLSYVTLVLALIRLSHLFDYSMMDLSFNLLKAVPEGLRFLSALRTVYFVQNRITKISGLEQCTNLTSLELGSNKIRVCIILRIYYLVFITRCQRIENLEALVNLEELWLGKNKITKLEVCS